MPRKQAGSLVPCALWWATHSQHFPCRGQSFGQGHDMLLCGQGMGIISILNLQIVHLTG